MNKTIFITALILVALTSSQVANAIYEDQSYICKQNNHLGIEENTQLGNLITCTIVNDDNVFSADGLDTLDIQFKHDLDTFSAQYLAETD